MSPLDVSVVVPVRNAEDEIVDCLESIVASQPREILVVDGCSTDRTRDIAARYPVQILSDDGLGLPEARARGARAASSDVVALIDADVVLPDGALAALLEEYRQGGYTALQAGLHSVGGPGYWGRALAAHHRTGRSRDWFGLVATVFDRAVLLEEGFDQRFLSGEDIDLRWRLRSRGRRVGVSERTLVTHRFVGDSFDFARGQWLADGCGLGRMVRTRGWRAAHLLALPLAAGVRGVGLSVLRRQPRWIPYYALFVAFNYVGIARAFAERVRAARAEGAKGSVVGG